MKIAILVVEDDEGILEGLAEFLESEGYEAQKASNGKRALELLAAAERLPSAILLDLMMPEMGGMGFRESQKKDPRIANIPIILMSADPQVAAKSIEAGITEFVKKPVDIDKLADKLKKVVGSG